MSRKEILEQFASCWEGLEDPRRGNAALHDFYELLMMVLCCVLCGGQGVVTLDGKALRRPFERASGKSSLRMVSAWGSEQHLVLAQPATGDCIDVPASAIC